MILLNKAIRYAFIYEVPGKKRGIKYILSIDLSNAIMKGNTLK